MKLIFQFIESVTTQHNKQLNIINNVTSVLGLVIVGTLFDLGVWFYVKDLKIFDEELEMEGVNNEKEKEIKK